MPAKPGVDRQLFVAETGLKLHRSLHRQGKNHPRIGSDGHAGEPADSIWTEKFSVERVFSSLGLGCDVAIGDRLDAGRVSILDGTGRTDVVLRPFAVVLIHDDPQRRRDDDAEASIVADIEKIGADIVKDRRDLLQRLRPKRGRGRAA